jgi:hypothetical protein
MLIADCPFRWTQCQHCNRTMMSFRLDDHLVTTTSSSHQKPRSLSSVDNNNKDNGSSSRSNSSNTSGSNVNKRSRTDIVIPPLLCKDMMICPNGCSSAISRHLINKHNEVCPLSVIKCSICSVECIRSSIIQHMNDNTQQHMIMMMSTTEKVASLTKENKELRDQVNSLISLTKEAEKVESLTKENKELRTEWRQIGRYASISLWYNTKLDDEKDEKEDGDNEQDSKLIEFGGFKWFVGAQLKNNKQDLVVYLYVHRATEAQLPVNVQFEIRIGDGNTVQCSEKFIREYSKADGYLHKNYGWGYTFNDGVMAAKDNDGMIYIECIFNTSTS